MIWIKFRYKIKYWYYHFLFAIGFQKKLLKNRYGEQIVVFHGIDNNGNTKFNSRFVSKAYFEAFISYTSKHYNVLSLEDFYLRKFKKGTLNIAITFDDGYYNNYKYAVPVLKKYGIPASFFITTIHDKYNYLWPDFIDLVSYHSNKKQIVFENNVYTKTNYEFIYNGVSLKNRCKQLSFSQIIPLFEIFKKDWIIIKDDLLDYWKLMTPKQIQELSKSPLFTIGSHAQTHVNLALLNSSEASLEFLKSKASLELICDSKITAFAFPFGYYNKSLIESCIASGFKKILLVDFIKNQEINNEVSKERFVINPHISLKYQLVCLLKGSYF